MCVCVRACVWVCAFVYFLSKISYYVSYECGGKRYISPFKIFGAFLLLIFVSTFPVEVVLVDVTLFWFSVEFFIRFFFVYFAATAAASSFPVFLGLFTEPTLNMDCTMPNLCENVKIAWRVGRLIFFHFNDLLGWIF